MLYRVFEHGIVYVSVRHRVCLSRCVSVCVCVGVCVCLRYLDAIILEIEPIYKLCDVPAVLASPVFS